MKRSLLIVVVLVTATALSAFGQESDRLGLGLYLPFDFSGGGARAMGMGGAYYGVSDDIAAGTWNPAGLVIHQGPKLALSYGGLVGAGHADVWVAKNTNVFRQDHDGSLGSVTDAIFVAPFRLRGHPFVGNFSYSKAFDGLSNYAFETSFVDTIRVRRQNIPVDEAFEFSVDKSQATEGVVRAVNIGFGTRVYGNTSMGATVNIYTGESVSNTHKSAMLPSFPEEQFEQEVRVDVDTTTLDTSSFSGVNFTIGFKHTGERMNLGLVIQTPFDLTVETNTSTYTLPYINQVRVQQISEIAFSDTTFVDDQVVSYGMPLMVGAGVGYALTDDLILSMDAEYRGFGSSKIKEREVLEITPGGNINEVFSDYDPGWNSGVAMRFGGEYKWDRSFGTIPLRAGVGFTPTPRPGSEDADTPTLNYVLPSLVFSPVANLLNKDDTPLMYSVSLGAGIHWSQIHLDWAYSYSQIDREVTDATGQFLLQNRDHHIAFTFTGVF